jgi:hypothetical protein
MRRSERVNWKIVLFITVYINYGKTNNVQPPVDQHSNSLDHPQHSNEPDQVVLHRITFDRGPYFDLTASKNITALVGKTAYLNCRVKNIGNRTVSLSIANGERFAEKLADN